MVVTARPLMRDEDGDCVINGRPDKTPPCGLTVGDLVLLYFGFEEERGDLGVMGKFKESEYFVDQFYLFRLEKRVVLGKPINLGDRQIPVFRNLADKDSPNFYAVKPKHLGDIVRVGKQEIIRSLAQQGYESYTRLIV